MANIDNAAAEMAAAGFFRIALGVEYKGSRYRGWQRQASGVPTVQETLEKALSKVADSPVSLMCAGRTDAGVHACGQVVHFDTQAERSMKAWVMGANINLPHDVSVSWAKVMPADFHARFKAIARRYRYVIYNDQIRPAHLNEEITWNHRPLDAERMAEAAQHLVGIHDFSAFRAGQCQAKSPIKEVHHLRVTRHGKMIVLDIRAGAFLHHMVRNIAGVLMTIGTGERPVEWAREVLESRIRRTGGVTAHPFGLYHVFPQVPVYPAEPRQRARARQVQAWLRSDLMPIRQERSTLVVFYGLKGEPLSPVAEAAAHTLINAAQALLADGRDYLFGAWSIADVDLAVMLNRLILNGDSVPANLVAYAQHQWQRPSVQEWVKQARPSL